MVPSHNGAIGAVPATGVIGLPQASFTAGGVGTTRSAIQAIVAVVFAGKVKSACSMVTVCTYNCVFPSQSAYVQVYVISPSQVGMVLTTGPLILVIRLPQLS